MIFVIIVQPFVPPSFVPRLVEYVQCLHVIGQTVLRQYRNPDQDVSGKKRMFDHPSLYNIKTITPMECPHKNMETWCVCVCLCYIADQMSPQG